jgi:hypothetical protein
MALTQNLESSAQRSHLESFDLFKKGVLGFEQLEKKTVMRSIRKSVTSPFAAIAKMKSTGDLKLPKKKVMRSGSRFSKPTMADAVKPVVDKIDIGSLSRSFNIPRRNLERMIDKFDRQRKSFSDE